MEQVICGIGAVIFVIAVVAIAIESIKNLLGGN